MSETIASLQNGYLREYEQALQDKKLNGDYTKSGLRHLANAGKCQIELANLTTGEAAKQHRALGEKIIRETYAHMQRLGLIAEQKSESTEPPQREEVSEPPQPKAAAPTQPTEAEPEDDRDPMEDLNGLIGLADVKKTVAEIINKLCVNRAREKKDIKTVITPMHMVFTGNPGTGKTTVARIVGRILKKNDLLSKGHLVEVNSSDVIEPYVGHTGKKMQAVIEQAKGGVLFIDEAYALAQNEFGKTEAVPALLTGLENNRDDFVVIVAGYTDDMSNFIKCNPGLSSRFPNYVDFKDYSIDELEQIFKSMCAQQEQVVSEQAEEALKAAIERLRKNPDFGNARGVRNLFDQAYGAMSTRIKPMLDANEPIDRATLTTFEKADIESAVEHIETHRL